MVVDMNSSLGAVIGFGLWTVGHIGAILGYRSFMINTGRALPNAFLPGRMGSPETLIGRIGWSHANCTENFPLFLATVVINTLTSGPDISSLAWYYMYARMGQSISHCSGNTDMTATVRFLFFATQLGLLGAMLYNTMMD